MLKAENKSIVRTANTADIRGINSLIINAGGATLLKASFGQFTIPHILESCILSLVSQSTFERESFMSFVSVNDVVKLNGDLDFDITLGQLKETFPDVKVRVLTNF